jgi:hypothetical protein
MANLNDIINLAKADGGKFFVMDENGNVKLVIMNIEDYQRMLLGKLQKQIVDVENINKEILKAQLQEPPIEPAVEVPKPKSPSVTQRNEDIRYVRPRVDLREEVIDPSFDFEGPKMDLEDF